MTHSQIHQRPISFNATRRGGGRASSDSIFHSSFCTFLGINDPEFRFLRKHLTTKIDPSTDNPTPNHSRLPRSFVRWSAIKLTPARFNRMPAIIGFSRCFFSASLPFQTYLNSQVGSFVDDRLPSTRLKKLDTQLNSKDMYLGSLLEQCVKLILAVLLLSIRPIS